MADINLEPSTVTGHAGPSDTELLAALQAAHEAGDTQAAMEIAAALAGQQVTHEPLPGGAGSPHAEQSSTAADLLHAYGNAVAGPVEGAMHLGSGLIAGPVAGFAGAGADIAHSLGADVDPAAVVNRVGNALTYSPRTEGGKATVGAIDAVGSVLPKVANSAGETVTDATGSPALGTIANTGIQGMGMILGNEAPAILGSIRRSAPVSAVTNLASDYLPGGTARAANRVITQYAGNTPGGTNAAALNLKAHVDAQEALARAGRSGALVGPQDLATKYGIYPTASQVAGSPGLAQLDRTIRNQGEAVSAPLNSADKANRTGIVKILEGISGTPEQRLRAATARDFMARTAYDDALNNPDHFVQPPKPGDPSFEAELAAKKGLPNADGTPSTNDPNAPASGLNPVGVRLQEVLQRPAMQTAMKNAHMQAANRGIHLDERNLIQQLHYAKMDLDGQISAASRSGDSTTMGGLLDTKNTLLGVMDDLSPAYKQARQGFQASSRPLNRMDVGEALRQKYLSALQDASGTGSRPSMFLDALRREDGDTLAQSATGFNGARMENILNPADLSALQVAREQLGREAYAQNEGRAVGSNTGQNLDHQRALDSVGNLSNVTGHLGELAAAVHNPLISLPLGIRGASVRAGAKARIASTLADPQATLSVLRPPPHKLPAAGIPAGVAGPAAIGAISENQDEGHADGGAVKKSTFWDLVQQAIKEVSAPSDPQGAPLGTGAANHAAQQIEANPNRIMNQADAQS
jgi:hypothetical protein